MEHLLPQRLGCCKRFWWLLPFVGLFVAGCTTVPQPHAVPLDQQRTEQILTAFASRAEQLSMLQGLFQVSIAASGVPLAPSSMNGVLYYQRPRFIRLKGLTRFGGIVFDFVQQGNRFTLQAPGVASQPLRGTLDQLEQRSEFGRPVRLALHAMGPMLGTIMQEDNRILIFQEGDRYRLDFYSKSNGTSLNPHARVWVNAQSYEPLRMDCLDPHGDPVLIVSYDEYKKVRSASSNTVELRLPYHVQARDLEQSVSVTMRFIEILATFA